MLFFDGIELYMHPKLYLDWFEKGKKPTIQNAQQTMPLILPDKLTGLQNIPPKFFTGVYDKNDLKDYFDSLKSAIGKHKVTESLALVFSSCNHTITVGFDPKSQQWFFIDANKLPAETIKNVDAIAIKVIKAFSQNGIASFTTRIYSSNTELEKVFKTWEQDNKYKICHLMSEDKINQVDSNGASWLYIATENGDLNTIQKLLKKGADPNKALKKDQVTPLHLAVKNGRLDIVEALLKNDADPDKALKKNGFTPLHTAILNNRIDIVKALLEKGADPNKALIEDYATPLHFAVGYDCFDIVIELLEKGADPNKVLKDGYTALDIAVERDRFDIIKVLLEKGADPNKAYENSAKWRIKIIEGLVRDKKWDTAGKGFFTTKTPTTIGKIRFILDNKDINDKEKLVLLDDTFYKEKLILIEDALSNRGTSLFRKEEVELFYKMLEKISVHDNF